MCRTLQLFTLIAISCNIFAKPNPSNERIVGGADTTIESHPYQLSFQLNGYHLCGAVLIDANIAVTAAHCTELMRNLTSLMTMRGGSSIKQSGGQVISVTDICIHPKYPRDATDDYDISVVKLASSFQLGSSVATIPLQERGVEIAAGTLGKITGWGFLQAGGSQATTLQAVDMPKVAHSVCQNNYADKNITDRMDCYGYPEGGRDACTSDSGGPMVVNGKLAGIISWGRGCAQPNKPGVVCKISDEEIYDHITNCRNRFSQ